MRNAKVTPHLGKTRSGRRLLGQEAVLEESVELLPLTVRKQPLEATRCTIHVRT